VIVKNMETTHPMSKHHIPDRLHYKQTDFVKNQLKINYLANKPNRIFSTTANLKLHNVSARDTFKSKMRNEAS
jgi:hypothetical protein